MGLYSTPYLPEQARLATKPLLTSLSSTQRAQAGIAIRSWHAIQDHYSNQSGTPTRSSGELICFPDAVRDINNVQCADRGMPCAILANTDDTKPVWCAVFTDRTAVVMRYEKFQVQDGTYSILRILPVVLRLASKVTIKSTGDTLALKVVAGHEKADIHTKFLHGCVTDDFKDLYGNPNPNAEQMALMVSLDDEITAWGQKIDDLPYILDPGTGPRAGVIGRDIPTPQEHMAGRPYLWPAVYAGEGFDKEQKRAASRYFSLAYAHCYDRVRNAVVDMSIAISAGSPKQSSVAPKTQIKVAVAPKFGEDKREVEAKIKKIFELYMHLPIAPPGIRKMSGVREIYQTPAKTKTQLIESLLFHASLENKPSNHDRLKAMSLFSPYL